MINNGFVKIHRKILDNPISDKPNYLAVWLFLILEANHEDRNIIFNNQKMTILRGQTLTSIRKISKKFKLSLGSVHKIINYLICERMIEREDNPQFSLITVLKYDDYQRDERKKVQDVNKTRTSRETNKNDKNEKNEKKRESSVNYLLEIPDEDIKQFTKEYLVNHIQVREKGETLHDYCKSKGKVYKDYRAFLQGAIRRDYGKRYEA